MQFFKNWAPFLVLSFVLALLLIPKVVLQAANEASTQRGPGGPRPAVVQTQMATTERFSQQREFTGTLLAREGVDLRPETAGKVVNIAFSEGSFVEKGQALLQLNDDELQAQLEASRQNLRLAQLQLERQSRLLQSGSTTTESFDEARIRVATLTAEVDLIEARLDKTRITAPFAGYIGLRGVSPGSVIDPSTVIATLQDIQHLKVDFAVPERLAARVRQGLAVSVRVEGIDRTFSGTIIAINPRIDVATRTLTCRAEIENPDNLLLPGAFARVSIEIASADNAIMLPATAVIPDLNRQSVYVVEDGIAKLRDVKIGTRTADSVMIVDGLRPGESVVTIGVQGLRPNSPVKVLPKES